MTATSGLNATRLENLSRTFQSRFESGAIPGAVLLLNQGGETWCQPVGYQDLESRTPMKTDTIFRIASMTKTIAAVATMLLVDDGQIDLHAPVDPWLPELADRKVLRTPASELDDTVPAIRPITTHDLLTNQWGLGAIFGGEPTALQTAMETGGLAPGAFPPAMTTDAWMSGLGALPLAFQPGQGWLYHTGFDVLCVLLARVAGAPLGEFLATRIFEPLGMPDTGFFVPPASIPRLATCYQAGTDGTGFEVSDPAGGGEWSHAPQFPSELVATATDYLTFARMLRSGGEHNGVNFLSRESVKRMTTDHVSNAVKDDYPFFPGFWERTGWGYGVSIVTASGGAPGFAPGSYGWSGGFNTHWMNDPANDLTGLLLMQLQMTELAGDVVGDFWKLAYQALDM